MKDRGGERGKDGGDRRGERGKDRGGGRIGEGNGMGEDGVGERGGGGGGGVGGERYSTLSCRSLLARTVVNVRVCPELCW